MTYIPTNQTTELTDLLLSHNSIVMSIADIKALNKYTRLTVLDLSYNLIEILPSTAFDSLMNLETLNLRENRLHSLPDDIFKGLSKLKTLVLENNPWDCSCQLMTLIKHLNDSGVSTGVYTNRTLTVISIYIGLSRRCVRNAGMVLVVQADK